MDEQPVNTGKWSNLNPKLWGSHAWFYLHSVTLSYPEQPTQADKQQMKEFLDSLIFPCTKCNHHYHKHLQDHPIDNQILESRKNVIAWLVDVHNQVNKYQKKPEMTPEEVIELYCDIYNERRDYPVSVNNTKNYIIVGLALLLVITHYLR